MNYWFMADLHLGHQMIVKAGHRPEGFEKRLLSTIRKIIQPSDVLIILGDVTFYKHTFWANELRNSCAGKLWITVGNHDKSAQWWMNHGADFAAEALTLQVRGRTLLCTHKPQTNLCGCDNNVHGHLHKTGHRGEYTLTDKHILIYQEDRYHPWSTKEILNVHKR